MGGRDRTTYGFRSDDADALLNLITMGDVETPIRRPMGGGGGGGTSIRYVIFTLTSVWTSSTASATFTEMNGDAIESSTLRDPLDVAASLEINDQGYALAQDGNYYFVQAPCPVVEP